MRAAGSQSRMTLAAAGAINRLGNCPGEPNPYDTQSARAETPLSGERARPWCQAQKEEGEIDRFGDTHRLATTWRDNKVADGTAQDAPAKNPEGKCACAVTRGIAVAVARPYTTQGGEPWR